MLPDQQQNAGEQYKRDNQRGRGESQQEPAQAHKTSAQIDVNKAAGKPYVLFEGNFLDTVLVNRLDGDAAGPVITMVTQPVYSHDRQHVLIPEGSKVYGEAKRIGESGFGQQRRLAIVFHRIIMPDGYSVDLDQFNGLDQIGEMGAKDKINNHYMQIFGTSVALGVLAGAAQVTQGGSSTNTSGQQMFTNGASSSISGSSVSILNKFLQIPSTITIRPGYRVKVYFTQDIRLPAYGNHTINQTY
jgi:type IV secretion system protein VirB10